SRRGPGWSASCSSWVSWPGPPRRRATGASMRPATATRATLTGATGTRMTDTRATDTQVTTTRTTGIQVTTTTRATTTTPTMVTSAVTSGVADPPPPGAGCTITPGVHYSGPTPTTPEGLANGNDSRAGRSA